MKLYIKQKVFSWSDKFNIYNENGRPVFSAKGEVFSFGKKLHIFDSHGVEVAFIHQKVFSLLPKYFISRSGYDVAEVVKKFTFFRSQYIVENFGWTVQGNYTAHKYEIISGNAKVASVSKKWLSWGDSYEIDIACGIDPVNVICVILIIDAVLAASSSSAANT